MHHRLREIRHDASTRMTTWRAGGGRRAVDDFAQFEETRDHVAAHRAFARLVRTTFTSTAGALHDTDATDWRVEYPRRHLSGAKRKSRKSAACRSAAHHYSPEVEPVQAERC